ncbi:MAG TPA: phosphate ABC transporter permease PstA [Planctomycetota bacterium]|nr:phosphate ABC transporter permease PstA [Planctomycetota bacterium]
MQWLTAGALAICLAMIAGLLALVIVQGAPTFWPAALVQVRLEGGETWLGEVVKEERFAPSEAIFAAAPPDARTRAEKEAAASEGTVRRRLFRTGNFELTNEHFRWIDDFRVVEESRPERAVVLERTEWGRFYGTPKAFLVDGKPIAEGPAAWAEFEARRDAVRDRAEERRRLEKEAAGALNRRLRAGTLEVKRLELKHGPKSSEAAAARIRVEEEARLLEAEGATVRARIEALDRENARYVLSMTTSDGREHPIPASEVVRGYEANRLGVVDRLAVYASRWAEYLVDEPREANSEGGVWPAIFGTVVMTLLMSLAVVPFGVLAALYLREYARQGALVSAVRIAVNNLAGVPSIVFGVFGLGFFCYAVGGSVDRLFFPEALPSPTFGTGGVLWASITLALLTLPVVIVASEEALAAVPRSMREGSYACGASKWQTIRRIVLPRAMPGIMTGMILAMARGAGEVAPLMLVGAVKAAPDLPVDGEFPYLHLERSFMHLGFHIYDLGFQSQNSEAAKPMVYVTTFLLILIIVALNLAAIAVRARLRRRFAGGHF